MPSLLTPCGVLGTGRTAGAVGRRADRSAVRALLRKPLPRAPLPARVPLPVALEVRLTERLPQPLEVTAYYVASETLANVVKYARADSARVRAERLDGRVVIEVADDGIGGADADEGSGLRGLRDRVKTLGGTLEIESAAGHGTLIRAALPIRREEAPHARER